MWGWGMSLPRIFESSLKISNTHLVYRDSMRAKFQILLKTSHSLNILTSSDLFLIPYITQRWCMVRFSKWDNFPPGTERRVCKQLHVTRRSYHTVGSNRLKMIKYEKFKQNSLIYVTAMRVKQLWPTSNRDKNCITGFYLAQVRQKCSGFIYFNFTGLVRCVAL